MSKEEKKREAFERLQMAVHKLFYAIKGGEGKEAAIEELKRVVREVDRGESAENFLQSYWYLDKLIKRDGKVSERNAYFSDVLGYVRDALEENGVEVVDGGRGVKEGDVVCYKKKDFPGADSYGVMLGRVKEADRSSVVLEDGVKVGRRNVLGYCRVSEGDIVPIGKGVFGDIYDQFKGRVKEAIAFLKGLGGGEALAALHHKDVGDIALVWGNDKAGLKKILRKHPEVVDNLQGVIDEMHVASSSDNRIVLESDTHKAVVSKKLGDKETEQWLLTAYEKKNAAKGGSSDIGPKPQNDGGKQNGTAPLQDGISSDGKGMKNSDGVQGERGENGGKSKGDWEKEEKPKEENTNKADGKVKDGEKGKGEVDAEGKEKEKIDDVGEKIAGARKDMLSDLAKKYAEVDKDVEEIDASELNVDGAEDDGDGVEDALLRGGEARGENVDVLLGELKGKRGDERSEVLDALGEEVRGYAREMGYGEVEVNRTNEDLINNTSENSKEIVKDFIEKGGKVPAQFKNGRIFVNLEQLENAKLLDYALFHEAAHKYIEENPIVLEAVREYLKQGTFDREDLEEVLSVASNSDLYKIEASTKKEEEVIDFLANEALAHLAQKMYEGRSPYVFTAEYKLISIAKEIQNEVINERRRTINGDIARRNENVGGNAERGLSDYERLAEGEPRDE